MLKFAFLLSTCIPQLRRLGRRFEEASRRCIGIPRGEANEDDMPKRRNRSVEIDGAGTLAERDYAPVFRDGGQGVVQIRQPFHRRFMLDAAGV